MNFLFLILRQKFESVHRVIDWRITKMGRTFTYGNQSALIVTLPTPSIDKDGDLWIGSTVRILSYTQ